ncbi:HelD family protein [Nocardioides dongxiaopingii]|uniref:HelD family protein n=1 Tax=Nocardioides sp. S-1144 TaxID=2582905 RepID=UPI0021CB68C2|nr:AAA family ATPase [Nocardioides sp. S-1144]
MSRDPAPDAGADDVELAAEVEHLAESRRQLARMRRRTASLDGAAAGDWVSQEVLTASLALRMEQLADDPTVPLFFGRLETTEGPGTDAESLHIGRRHVSDELGDPLVVDWRAPVSLPFYRASAREPMGVRVRRRYGFQEGRLTAFEDEDLTGGAGDGDGADEGFSEILESEIERPRVGPMRDIVATIQPEQDVIVRAELTRTICVQGAPGTGKTAVGLHRAAYLLYAHRDQLRRQGVLVVGPNASFLRYIREVLPALGEVEATQSTIDELVVAGASGRRAVEVRTTDPAAVAVLKGDARMAVVLERAVWGRVAAPTEPLVVPWGSRRWRVAADDVAEVLDGLRARGVRHDAGRAMLPQALAHRVLSAMADGGESPDDRVQDAVARSRPVREYVKQLWPQVDPARVVWLLLSDPAALEAAAAGVLEPAEQEALRWARPSRAPGSARWSLADVVLLDEAGDLLNRTPSLAHIVVDEAQDLSPMMLRALARRASTGSLTVLGDLAQATTPWATRSWAEALGHLGKPDAHVEQLTRGFRVPGEVIEYAARLLPHIAPDLEPPTSVRRSRGELVVSTDPVADVALRVGERVGSVAVVVPDARVDHVAASLLEAGVRLTRLGEDGSGETWGEGASELDAHLDLVPASLAKGLEFDHVVLLDPEGIVAGEPDRVTGLRRLYVCLTRAVTSLTLLPDGDLPAELGPPDAEPR